MNEWLLLIYDIPKADKQAESTIRSRISRELNKHPNLLPVQQSVYALRDSEESRATLKGIIRFMQDEFGEGAKLMVFKGQADLAFSDKDVEKMVGHMLDNRYNGMEVRAETLKREYKRKKVTLRAAKGRLAKLLLKFEQTAKNDQRDILSPARVVAQNKLFELEKELTEP